MSEIDRSFESQLERQRQTSEERKKSIKEAILDLLKTKSPKEITYKVLEKKLGTAENKIRAMLKSAYGSSPNLQDIIEGIIEHREEEK